MLLKYIIKIDGMKCGMCAAHIANIVRKTISIKKVKVSHKKNTCIIITGADIELVIKEIENMGYKVTDIKQEEYKKRRLFW